MDLIVPSSFGMAETSLQLVEFKSVVCWREKPVLSEGQETTTVFVSVGVMVKSGGFDVGWTNSMLQ